MKHEFNKTHEYRGYIFNIKVKLNFIAEKTINGKKLHQITINDMGVTNYYTTRIAKDSTLEKEIENIKSEANFWVDGREDPSDDEMIKLLTNLGFK